jgi:3-hydroxyacyl-[acyl-carrier-protein] dehydratase
MVLSKEEIKKIIPHRDPFLFVDGVSAMDATQTVEAFYDVRENDMYFEGHFPEHKVMPGVIILEAMAQAGAVCLLSNPDFTGKLIVFAGADKVKFKRPVYPGDRLILKLTTLSLR